MLLKNLLCTFEYSEPLHFHELQLQCLVCRSAVCYPDVPTTDNLVPPRQLRIVEVICGVVELGYFR